MNLIFPTVSTLLLAVPCIVCLVFCVFSLGGAQGNTDVRAVTAFGIFAVIAVAAIYYIWAELTDTASAIGLAVFIGLLVVMVFTYRMLVRD